MIKVAIDSSQLILKVKWFKKNEKFYKGMYKQIICMFIQSHMIVEMVMWYSHDLLKVSCDWYPCLFSLFFLNNVFDLSHQCVHVYEEHGGWNGETNSRWTERERESHIWYYICVNHFTKTSSLQRINHQQSRWAITVLEIWRCPKLLAIFSAFNKNI